MRARSLSCLLIVLTVTSAGLGLTAQARAADLAHQMPADTMLYAGWGQWYDADDPEVGLTRRMFEGVRDMVVTEDPNPSVTTLLTLLADAVVTLQTSPGAIGLIDVAMHGQQPDIQAAMLVQAGDQASRMADAMRQVFVEIDQQEAIRNPTIRGVSASAITIPDSPFEIVWTAHDDYFIAAIGQAAADKVFATMLGQAKPLADMPELQYDRKKLGLSLDEKYFCIYVDVDRMVQRGKAVGEALAGKLPPIVDQLLTELGITSMKSKYAHFDNSGDKPIAKAFIHVDGPRRGLLTLWDQAALTPDDLAIIPKNAYWAEVGNLDLAALWRETLRVIEAVSPDAAAQAQGFVAMGAQFLGFSITEELLPAFGDTWALVDGPDHGGFLFTGTTLVVDVEDFQKIQRVMHRITQMADPWLRQEGMGLRINALEHGDHTILYALVTGAPMPVAPAWAHVDGRWIFGLNPQTVAAAAKQVDPATRGPSILDHPDVKALGDVFARNPLYFSFVDTKRLTRALYPLLNAFNTMGVSQLGAHDVEIDMVTMPTVAELVAQSTNSVTLSHADNDGVVYMTVGDGSSLGALFAVTALGAGISTSVMMPAMMTAREHAKSVKSMANLKQIGIACMLYSSGDPEERLPSSFDELIEAGMITRDVLTAPDDPPGTVSYTLVPRSGPFSREQTPHRNVLAYERTARDGEIAVLFADGHVQQVSQEEFDRALKETRRRLDKLDQQ